jgi:peroxin-1
MQYISEVVTLGGVDKLLNKIEQYMLANLSERELKNSLNVPTSGGVLLSGTHGSGKTSIMKHIMKSAKRSLICKSTYKRKHFNISSIL